jgi:predicted flap endonuclease-1-like 5' DNA nuclease
MSWNRKFFKLCVANKGWRKLMRTHYLLYALAVVFFIITAASLALVMDATEKNLWVVSTAVVGLFSASLGYIFRPKTTATAAPTTEVSAAQPVAPVTSVAGSIQTIPEPTRTPIALIPDATREIAPIPSNNIVAVEVSAPQKSELLTVKGINAKRAEQLNTLGIHRLGDLAKASAEDLAKQLTVSPRITRMWIGSAKKLSKQS